MKAICLSFSQQYQGHSEESVKPKAWSFSQKRELCSITITYPPLIRGKLVMEYYESMLNEISLKLNYFEHNFTLKFDCAIMKNSRLRFLKLRYVSLKLNMLSFWKYVYIFSNMIYVFFKTEHTLFKKLSVLDNTFE